jgi:DNA replication and repair protein RecF
MQITKLQIVNFKNYENVQCDFHPKFNLITGLNGEGKTNLIDAVYYLGLTRSYFNHNDTHNFRHETDVMRIAGVFDNEAKKLEIAAKLRKRKDKSFEKNKKKYDKLSEHIGLIPTVMIAPKDQQLIYEGSEERRRFLNSTISQIDKTYLSHLMEYNYVLRQRNQLLKDYGKYRQLDTSLLDIYDKNLVGAGSYIYEKRKEIVELLVPIFKDMYGKISGHSEVCDIKYRSKLAEKGFSELLAEAREKDKIMQRSTVGVHKDDLKFFNEENAIRYVGSQGQQKSFVLALKLTQYMLLKKFKEMKPIVLLDDIFDKLDGRRVMYLIQLLQEIEIGQVFITDTELDRLKLIFEELNYDFDLFEVKDNLVNKIVITKNEETS